MTAQQFVAQFHDEHPGECLGCWHLRSMGIKCNVHRTEGSVTRLLRLADEAGLVLTGSPIERAMAAEKALGLASVVL